MSPRGIASTVWTASLWISSAVIGVSAYRMSTAASSTDAKYNFPGVIASYGGHGAPAGWLICDGASIDSSEQEGRYKQLIEAIRDPERLGSSIWGDGGDGTGPKVSLPDLRGMFLRGVDNGASVDPDANVRTDKPTEYIGNRSGVGTYQWFATAAPTGVNGSPFEFPAEFLDVHRGKSVALDGTGRANVGGGGAEVFPAPANKETRPRNAAVNWIIKY